MVDAAPFRALRYDPAVAGPPADTSAPAYDVLDPADYARHRTASPYTVLQLLADHADGYAAAADAYARWRRTGVLLEDVDAALYVYEQRDAVGTQRGVLAAVALVEPGAGSPVAVHEGVDASRVAERIARLRAVPVDLAPVYGVVSDAATGLPAALAGESEGRPVASVVDSASVAHRVWRVDEPERVAHLLALLGEARVVIADGHHRYAAALALAHRGGDPRTLLHVTTSSGQRVGAVHRLVRGSLPHDWRSHLAPEVVAAQGPRDVHELLHALDGEPPGTVALRTCDGGWLLRPVDLPALRAAMPPGTSAAWRSLDAALLSAVLLPRLGVEPWAVEPVVDLAAVAGVDAGDAAALALVRPVTLDEVLAVADAGEVMPPKTTSFQPKPRTGLVMRALRS